MQQYRVNYSLLIGLVVGTLVSSGAVYGLWKYQIQRKSGWLVSEAEKAVEAGDYREAVQLFRQYLTIQPGDAEMRVAYAFANADLTHQDDVTIEELNMAWRVLESAVRDRRIGEMPESEELRRRLVELYGRDNIRRYQDALDHLGYMLQEEPDDAELQVLRAKYLVRSGSFDEAARYSYQLIGYDPESDTFDADQATAPHETEVYTNVAGILRTKQERPELADRIMDRLVEVNPDSAEAYLARGQYRVTAEDADGAQADIEQAYALAPENADVLLAMSDQAAKEEEYERAGEYLAKGKELHPQDPRFYQAAADILVKQGEHERALAEVDEGLKTVKGQKGNILLIFKADLQFHANDLKGVRQSMHDMSRAGFRSELIDWYGARILLAENKWFEASEALNRLRPKVNTKVNTGFGDLPQQIDNFLGLCYEKLGRPDLALEQYQLVLQENPGNEPALAGKQRMMGQIGLEPAAGEADPWQQAVAEELKKPRAEQDWPRLEAMMREMAQKRELDDATVKILEAQLKLMREDFDGARQLLAEANRLSPKNLQIHRMMVQLTRMDPKAGPDEALELWRKVVDEFGDQAALRIDKADILIAAKAGSEEREELKAELAGLLSGTDDWSERQKVELWGELAKRYLNLGLIEEGRQYLTLAAEHQPNNLPLRLSLFALALDANDDDGMKEAQNRILEIVGSTNDSAWLYTEARRRLSLVRRGQLEPEALDEIRLLISRAMGQRREWHELHVLSAELELLARNPAKALEHYDRAQRFGRPSPTAVAQHIRLLAAVGRLEDAGKLLDRIPEALRQTLLGQLYAEILFRTNQVESAIQQARAAVESNPTSPQNHFWHGQLLARSAQAFEPDSQQRKERMARAIAAMEKAVELEAEFPEAWFALISYHGTQGDLDRAQAALREAQLSLSGDNLQMFLARSYEALGRWFDAEMMYRAVYESAPDDPARAQQLAAFYLGPAYPRPDRQMKATPLINQILRLGADGKVPPNDSNLMWARRMGAKMLAATGDYQKLRKAEKLLASNSRDGSLSIEDKLEMASILANRHEPLSRLKAVELLEEVSRIQPLGEQAEIALGELYYKVGRDWPTYASQMEKAIARYPNSVAAREAYVRRLLTRNDQRSIDKTGTHVRRLRQLAPKSMSTFELTVRLASKVGKQQQVRDQLLRMVPDLSQIEELTSEQMQMLSMLAELLVELEDLDSAERIYRGMARVDPNQAPALAGFLGLHRGVAQAFEKLNEINSQERLPSMIQVAISVVRQRRDEVGEKFDPEIQRWLDAGLRENPDSISLLIMQADLYDLQRHYDKSADVYRKLLGRRDLTGLRRAVVLNNLAFLVALAGPSAAADDEPLKLVQEAAEIMGPNSDILDTRAVVLMSRGQYQDAIHDLELAVTDNPTASKYFHKAQAHLLAGENRAAVGAWEKAEELGLDREAINRMEHERYEETKLKIDQVRGASVTRAEPLRRAS